MCRICHVIHRVYNLFVISPQGPSDSLGISVAGGVGSPHGNVPLFIATMDTNGLAAKTQKLQVGSVHVYTYTSVCSHRGNLPPVNCLFKAKIVF